MIRGIALFLLFLFPWICSAQTGEIRILHINDFHGFALPHKPLGEEEPLGGIAWLASRVAKLRKEKPTLFLAAGDMIQGDNWANLFKGESVIRVLNTMALDAMVLGNHEFDFGQKVLLERIQQAHFSILGANVMGLEGILPHVVKELGGVRVAIIGILGADTLLTTHPKNLAGLRFLDPASTLAAQVLELVSRADVLVALTHCGFAADRDLVAHVPRVQVIVGGHSHTKLKRPAVVGKTIIVQAWEHGKALGVLDLWVENGSLARFEGHLEEIRPSGGEPQPDVQNIVEDYSERLKGILGQNIGETLVDLDGENVRHRETNLGNLVADLLRDVSGAQVAILNGGSIRRSIPKGLIRMEDVYSALPFDNYVVAMWLTGRQLWEALEHGVGGRGSGRFAQVSGMKILYEPWAPEGSRLKEVKVQDKPLDPEKSYLVATNDFLAAGGDGYRSFTKAITGHHTVGGALVAQGLVFSDPGRWVRDLLVDYIRRASPLRPSVEGRILEASRR